MKLLAILSANKFITLSAIGVLSLATVGGVILNNSNEEPKTVQSSVTFDGEVKESPTAEIVEVEKVEEVETKALVTKEENIVAETALTKEEVISYISSTYTQNESSLVIVFLANEALFTKDNYKNLLEGMDVFLSNPDNRVANMGVKSAEVERLASL